MRLKKTFVTLFLLLMILSITGCKNKNDETLLKQKADEEIQYLDTTLISLANKLNNISFENYYVTTEKVKLNSTSQSSSNSNSEQSSSGNSSKSSGEDSGDAGSEQNKESNITVSKMKSQNILLGDRKNIDWDSLKTETENLYSAWNSILIDLYKLGVNNEESLKFSANLDDVISNVKQEKQAEALNSIANLYNIIPTFMDAYSAQRTDINLKWTKAHILKAYSSVNRGDWNTVTSEVGQAEQAYNAVLSDVEFVNKKSYNTNKTYVTLKELQNSIASSDEDIFYIKYKNLMEEINLL